MKTESQINVARHRLAERLRTEGMSDEQEIMLVGMLNALVWAADGANARTMERLLTDEPMAVGNQQSAVPRRAGTYP